MRIPATLTIDEMPESERPKRTVFSKVAESAEAAEPTSSADPIVTIHHSDWTKFQQIIFEALGPFADARSALAAAFELFRQQHGGPLYEST